MDKNQEVVPVADVRIQCVNCKNMFLFTVGEQRFYQAVGLKTPRRCADCRKIKRLNDLQKERKKDEKEY